MNRWTRREALAFGATMVVGARARASATCVLAPALTEGPFFVDEKLERADLTRDSHDGKTRPGLPLTISIALFAYEASRCTPLVGAQVDVWHCDAQGAYSDADNMGQNDTRGHDFLRGFQRSDAHGLVTFRSIYPGWYHGRTVHIHAKVRQFDPQRNVTTLATTQLFFDDATSDRVFASHAAYAGHGTRELKNRDDGIYGGRASLLCALDGSATSGFTARASLGIAVGVVQTEQHPPFGGPPPGYGGPPPWGRPPREGDR